MVVDRPTANAPFNTNRILVTQPFQEIVPLPGISWSEAIPQMLQQLLVEHLQAGKLVVPLSRENGGLRAAYVCKRKSGISRWLIGRESRPLRLLFKPMT